MNMTNHEDGNQRAINLEYDRGQPVDFGIYRIIGTGFVVTMLGAAGIAYALSQNYDIFDRVKYFVKAQAKALIEAQDGSD